MSVFNIRLSLNNLLLCLIKKKEKKRKQAKIMRCYNFKSITKEPMGK